MTTTMFPPTMSAPIQRGSSPEPSLTEWERLRQSFRIFNEEGGKFRVAVINACNLNCFFCHNEAMENPRVPGKKGTTKAGKIRLGVDDILGITNAYGSLGGSQINITGGEPLAHPEIVRILADIEKGPARLMLNTNALLAHKLLRVPKIENLDGILASLHTTSDGLFQKELRGRPGSAAKVMENIVAVGQHGYEVHINYSLGDYNKDEFRSVVEFAVKNGVHLKAIALVRPNESPDFYGGSWIDPRWISDQVEALGARPMGAKKAFGGRTTIYQAGKSTISIKNVARGRLMTDFCDGCPHSRTCGEGIYGLRVGVDGVWKPCLLRHERFLKVESPETESYELQILRIIDSMIGQWPHARFLTGAPD